MNPDIIIIGSGISGLNFALSCAAKDFSVLVITKKKIVETATNRAQGGIAAVLQKTDNFKKHVEDTLTAGAHHNNKKAVEFMVKNGPAAISKLTEFGVNFATQDGKLVLTREGGHSERRIAFVGDYTGREIESALIKQVRKNPKIKILENTFVSDLLVKDKKCFGVEIIRSNRLEQILAKFTVLATGGIGQIYSNTTNPEIATGDGFAMAGRAGCEFLDMEFIQFHPTAKGKFLLTEALRGEGALLKNSKGERFMPRYHKLAELAPRDVTAYAVFLESMKGPVYLDISHRPAMEIRARFPMIYKTLKEKHNLDLTRDPIPISPAAHFCCGGIKVDLKGRTCVKNLFAFGEVAGTGVHGANRLASNSLLEALVFSSRIISELKKLKSKKVKFSAQKLQSLNAEEKRKTTQIRTKLKKIMWENVGVVRTENSLKKAVDELEKLLEKLPKKQNQGIIETKNMLQTGLLIARAALKRKKSLGCHMIEKQLDSAQETR